MEALSRPTITFQKGESRLITADNSLEVKLGQSFLVYRRCELFNEVGTYMFMI